MDVGDILGGKWTTEVRDGSRLKLHEDDSQGSVLVKLDSVAQPLRIVLDLSNIKTRIRQRRITVGGSPGCEVDLALGGRRRECQRRFLKQLVDVGIFQKSCDGRARKSIVR